MISLEYWDLGVACALSGGKLTDNPIKEECFNYRQWRRGFIHQYRKIHGVYP